MLCGSRTISLFVFSNLDLWQYNNQLVDVFQSWFVVVKQSARWCFPILVCGSKTISSLVLVLVCGSKTISSLLASNVGLASNFRPDFDISSWNTKLQTGFNVILCLPPQLQLKFQLQTSFKSNVYIILLIQMLFEYSRTNLDYLFCYISLMFLYSRLFTFCR